MGTTTKIVARQSAQVHTSEVLHINGIDCRLEFCSTAFTASLPDGAFHIDEDNQRGGFRITPVVVISDQVVSTPARARRPAS